MIESEHGIANAILLQINRIIIPAAILFNVLSLSTWAFAWIVSRSSKNNRI
ncbi:MAG: hypothetical protein KAQ90_10650 [Melioribacteraceae bacterium]|nr:hypothetical protein [Melioribacteraceae bacterium]